MSLGTAEECSPDDRAAFDRIDYPPRGRDGGLNGDSGFLSLASGAQLRGKGTQHIAGGERLVIHTPGGAGHGDPYERAQDLVLSDLRNELISVESAAREYGYTVAEAN